MIEPGQIKFNVTITKEGSILIDYNFTKPLDISEEDSLD